MAKPVLLTIDDDPEVLRAIERDLRKQLWRPLPRPVRASGPAALELLKKIEQRNESVALFLVDHRMPQMNGIEFLAQAIKLYPECQARPVDRLRRHRRRHPRHQRGEAESLPAEAVGSAGAESLPGSGRSAG